jgi:flagella synthesis protein FlgN
MNAANKPDSHLKEERQIAQQLVELLKQEQAQLVKADINGLTAVTEDKARAVNNMATLTELRYKALAAAGFAPKEDGMQAWIDAAAPRSEAEQCWKELLQFAQSAKSLNSTNGLLIGKHMTYNQKALNILQGSRATNFYGPNGQATTTIGPRGLVVG